MDKIEEIVLNNTHVWGPAPYNKVNKPSYWFYKIGFEREFSSIFLSGIVS